MCTYTSRLGKVIGWRLSTKRSMIQLLKAIPWLWPIYGEWPIVKDTQEHNITYIRQHPSLPKK